MIDEGWDRVIEGMEDAIAIARRRVDPATYQVHAPAVVDVRALRHRLGLSQAAFCARFGFPTASVEAWEQGAQTPEASARILLLLIDREPEAVSRVLDSWTR